MTQLFKQDGDTRREFTSEEYSQYATDQAVALLAQGKQLADETIIKALEASIGVKRMSATWAAFTQAEVNYLNSISR